MFAFKDWSLTNNERLIDNTKMRSYFCSVPEMCHIRKYISKNYKENKSDYPFRDEKIMQKMQKIYKNKSKKLSQCNLIWIIIIKLKN